MATTCRDVITRALRKLGHLGKTANPSASDAEMGMYGLQALLDGWAAGGKFGRLRDVHKTDAYEAKAFERVRSTAAVTLPTYDQVTDDDACCGDDYGFWRDDCGRPVNRAIIQVLNPTTGVHVTHLWDALKGQWVQLTDLAIGDDCPLADLGADDLACVLAVNLQDETGQTAGPSTVRRASLFEQRLTFKPDSRRAQTAPQFI